MIDDPTKNGPGAGHPSDPTTGHGTGASSTDTGTGTGGGSTQGSAQGADLRAKIAEDVGATRDSIRKTSDTAAEKVKEKVSEQTHFAARQIGGIATALEKVDAELENSDQPQVGRYAKQIGSSVQNFAKQVEGREIGEVATIAEEFGRKQPLAFLGIAALAGLAASRFLTASAKTSSPSSHQSSTVKTAGGPATGTSARPQTTSGQTQSDVEPVAAKPVVASPQSSVISGGSING